MTTYYQFGAHNIDWLIFCMATIIVVMLVRHELCDAK